MRPSTQLHRARELFEKALDRPEGERRRFLDDTCDGDTALRQMVEELLHADSSIEESGGGFLSPIVRILPKEPESGARIGNYQIERRIATGGMGSVFEARQQQPSRKVAIKLLRTGLATNSAVARFHYESECLGRLQHPAIAQVYEAGTDDKNIPFFAMEYVEDGLPITQFANSRKLALRARVRMMVVVCDAVHHGHQKGVLHRDLKPSNILVDAEGRPKIIDFGVARAIGNDTEPAGPETLPGQIIGTLAYMAPEQIGGAAGDVDIRCDVYSLGVVLYELFCGRLPYELAGKPLGEALRILTSHHWRSLRSQDARVPRELDWIVTKALAHERERRYASASELAADLKRWLDGAMVSAGPPSAIYRIQTFARQHRGLAAGAALGAAALLIGVIGLGAGLVEAKDANKRANDNLNDAIGARNAAQAEAKKAAAMFHFVQEALSPFNREFEGDVNSLGDQIAAALEEVDAAFPDDPAVSASLRQTLASVFLSMGLTARAEPQLRIAYEQLHNTQGDDDPETIRAAAALGFVLLNKGKFSEAADYLKDGYHKTKEVMGASSKPARNMLRSLLVALEGAGRWAEGEALVTEYYEIQKQQLGPNSYLAIRAETRFSTFLCAQGRAAEAVERLRRLVDSIQNTRTPAEERRRVDARRHLARALLLAGREAEAEQLFTQIFEMLERGTPYTGRPAGYELNRAELLIYQSKPGEAVEIALRAVEEIQKARNDRIGLAHGLYILGKALLAAGRSQEAEQAMRKSSERALTLFGDGHAVSLECQLELGRILSKLARGDEARELLTSVADRAARAGGPSCPLAARARAAISEYK